MKKNILFWDFDGVIADSQNFTFNYWRDSFQKRGITFSYKDFQETFVAKFPFDYLKTQFGNVAQEIFSAYSNYEKDNYHKQVLFFPNISLVITKLLNNFEHNIISSNLAEVIKKTCKKNGLNNMFKNIIGREVSGYKDEKILKILKETDQKPQNCFMIGDSTSDILHGQKVGVKTIGVTWGVHTKKILQISNPTFLANNPEELLIILENEKFTTT